MIKFCQNALNVGVVATETQTKKVYKACEKYMSEDHVSGHRQD